MVTGNHNRQGAAISAAKEAPKSEAGGLPSCGDASHFSLAMDLHLPRDVAGGLNAVHEFEMIELLFSYGTLQQESV